MHGSCLLPLKTKQCIMTWIKISDDIAKQRKTRQRLLTSWKTRITKMAGQLEPTNSTEGQKVLQEGQFRGPSCSASWLSCWPALPADGSHWGWLDGPKADRKTSSIGCICLTTGFTPRHSYTVLQGDKGVEQCGGSFYLFILCESFLLLVCQWPLLLWLITPVCCFPDSTCTPAPHESRLPRYTNLIIYTKIWYIVLCVCPLPFHKHT